jgi:hypothetical protein
MAVVAVALIVWDIHVASNAEEGDTISELIYRFGQRHLLIPVAFGVFVGHFFWPQRVKDEE